MSDKSVLYAEDDENDTFFMQRAFLRLQKADVLYVVGDGAKAIEYLQEVASHSADPIPLRLALLDLKMPYHSGLEVLEWARKSPQYEDLPVVMLTSSTQEKDIAYAAAHGANAYLVKPLNADELAVMIEELLVLCLGEPRVAGRLEMPGNLLPRASVA